MNKILSNLPRPLHFADPLHVIQRGRKLVYFGGCDYLRMSSHPEVVRAWRGGVERFGLNVAASRRTTGNQAGYGRLERQLARFFGVEAAVLVGQGYAANLVLAQALAGAYTHTLLDAGAHGSLQDAAVLLGRPVLSFAHRDTRACARRLQRLGPEAKPLLLTDGVFSADGAVAPLEEYGRLLPRAGLLWVDEAHGAGVLGERGRGAVEWAGLGRARVVQTITLSKAFGVFGGAVLGSHHIAQRIWQQSRMFTGHTPLPAPVVSAARESVNIVADQPARRRRLAQHTQHVKASLRARGWEVVEGPSPIIAITPRDDAQARQLKRRLLGAGVYPSHLHYPGGAPGGYFRFALSSEHTEAHLQALLRGLGDNVVSCPPPRTPR